jgi:glycosyltransferase involved in cell wall biosynthesis
MNILALHVVSDMYGSSKVLLQAVTALKQKGHKVCVVVSEEGPLTTALQKVGIQTKIIRLGILRRRYFNFFGIINRAVVLTCAFFALKKLCKTQQIDLIYTNTAPVVVGGLLAKFTGIKNVWHLHEILEKESFMHRFFGKLINATASKVIVVSNAVYNNWAGVIDARKMVTVYNGYNASANDALTDATIAPPSINNLRQYLGVSSDTVIVGMVGRVNLFKGQSYYIDIVAAAKAAGLNCHFVMIGDAYTGYEYLYEILETKISEFKLQDCITNLHYQANAVSLIAQFDIFVLPSIKPDPFPVVMLEAMAVAKPIIATAQGGALEQIDDCVTGFLVPINDAKTASEKLGVLVNSPFIRSKMGEAGKQKLQTQFSEEAFNVNIVNQICSFV